MDHPGDPDLEFIVRIQGGDESALVAVMDRYRKPVLSFVYRMLGDATEAEDIAQEVFVRVWQNARGFKPRALFSTWLFQIARNAVIDRVRRRKRRALFHALELRPGDAPIIGKNPATDFQTLEIGEQIARAVAELPEDQRAALVLSEYEGLSQQEIADILKCTVKSVEGHLYRARISLRRSLSHLVEE